MTPTDIRDTAIPEDVMEAAIRAWDGIPTLTRKNTTDAIARAIMAERERLSSLLAVIEAIAEFGPTDATQVIAQRILDRFKAEQSALSTPSQGERVETPSPQADVVGSPHIEGENDGGGR